MSDTLQSAIDHLRQDVAAQADVAKSAETLIAGIPGLIQDAISKAEGAGATPEQLQALHDLDQQIQAQSKALSDAVTANTPAAPAQGDTGGATGATGATGPADGGGAQGGSDGQQTA
jgi:hypothetical protein